MGGGLRCDSWDLVSEAAPIQKGVNKTRVASADLHLRFVLMFERFSVMQRDEKRLRVVFAADASRRRSVLDRNCEGRSGGDAFVVLEKNFLRVSKRQRSGPDLRG